MGESHDGTLMRMVDTSEWYSSVLSLVDQLPGYISMEDISDLFEMSPAHVRRLRWATAEVDPDNPVRINQLPPESDDFRQRRPLLWRTPEIIQWGLWTGRIDAVTGERRSLGSRGKVISTPLVVRP